MNGGPPVNGVAMVPMRWWHLPAVAALETRIFEDAPWSLEQFYAELAAPGRWLRVLMADGAVAGYVDVAVTRPDSDLMTIAVAPQMRGLGLGRWLLRQAMAAAASAGAGTMFLEVRSDNPAQGIYLREGFEQLDVRRDYYGPGVAAVVMRRRLAGAVPAVPAQVAEEVAP